MSVLSAEVGAAVANSTVNLFHHITNASDHNQTLDDSPAYMPSGDNNIFFIFPAMGFIVLVMGSLYLRHQRIEQSQQSARAYDARLRAQHESIRQKKALRLEMVENALVTTKVVVRNKQPIIRRSSFALTESTLDSSSDSEINLQSEDVEAQTNVTYASVTLECPINMDGWKLESCAICLEAYQENDSVSYSKHQNCSHAFHTKCILNWLQDEYRNDCPCCRSEYIHVCITEPEEDEDIFVNAALVADSNEFFRQERANNDASMAMEQPILIPNEEQAVSSNGQQTEATEATNNSSRETSTPAVSVSLP